MPRTEPIVAYTGTRLWVGRPRVGPSRKGRVEHGPGIYLTTSLQTARKYAKGRGVVLRVTIDPDFTWLESAVVPTSILVAWVQSQRGLRRKDKIIYDIQDRGHRGLSDRNDSRLVTFVNLMVNHEAVTGKHGPALANFLSDLGVGASLVRQSGEDWVVVFDTDKILSWEKVSPDDTTWDLQRLHAAGR